MESEHRVLVVDNEPLVVEELIEYLSAKGYDCMGCGSPSEALQTFVGNPEIDIVLSDFKMPSMSGIELVETLNSIAGSGRIFEAIIFTGNAEKNDVIAALRAGVADYFQKPLDLDSLVEGLAKVRVKLGKRHGEAKIRMLSHNLNAISNSLSEICTGVDTSPNVNTVGSTLGSSSEALPMPEPFKKLSRRQRDVANLIVKGATNYQIACELGISENTVKLYVSQTLRVFDLNNRTQLALALGQGMSER